MRNAYNILVGKPGRERPFRRTRRRWEDNIIMDVREIWWEGVDWMHVAQHKDHLRAALNTVMNLWAP
jgi:hypothetical protein